MWSQNEGIATKIGTLGTNACADLFSAYGLELEPGSSGASWGGNDQPLLSGSIGFVGRRIRGTCLLATEERCLLATCPEQGVAMRDWIGELTNQFMGRLKTKLLAHGVEVFVTTPIVLSGVRIQPLPRAHVEPAVFSSHAGSVLTWIELETHPELVLGLEQPGFNGEGDVIVF
jgi:CheY-specific phosphatase CheX